MTEKTCPYCGKKTDQAVCPRCYAEISRNPEEKPVKAEKPVKKAKTNKEV